MKTVLFLAPASADVGLTTVALGLTRSLDRLGLRTAFFKPIAQTSGEPERSTHFIRKIAALNTTAPIPLQEAEQLLAEGRSEELMSRVIRDFHHSSQDADFVVVEGLIPTTASPIERINVDLAKTLSADVILVTRPGRGIDLSVEVFGTGRNLVVGVILNRVAVAPDEPTDVALARTRSEFASLYGDRLHLIGAIPENEELGFCRTSDIATHLGAEILNSGEIATRRVKSIHLLASTVPHLMHTLRPGAVLITPADRYDVLIAIMLVALNHVPLAGLLVTGQSELDPRILDLCKPAFATGLPVLRVRTSSFPTTARLGQMSPEIPADDLERMEFAMDFVAAHLDATWLKHLHTTPTEPRLSPAAFMFQLTEQARRANSRILLPEGDEPRTIRAAAICQARGIARCVLMGNPAAIRAIAAGLDVALPPEIEIIDCDAVRERYVPALVAFRKHKGLSAGAALDQLSDPVVLGTVMLAMGEADGLVSGAVHSSANTIRPALQIIKTEPGAEVVSSIFFMCLPDQVLVYGDCAVNTDPTAAQLADIAIQSADSAARFGIPPLIAMISYSTGESGSGVGVDKVREATRLVKERRPDLIIDGPLQYDAAAIADVAATKAPGSPVAGRATVFIFPDLNTGNTTYKAVQRAANVISIGPMLQGLKRPVNDLSRGALVEDILYTIALTAIQAKPEK